MSNLTFYIFKLLSKLGGNKFIVWYYKKCGMIIGNNTKIYSKIVTSEPYLIEIGEYSTIATNVSLLTHDASIGALKNRNTASDLCGKIVIGNHCFVGADSIILYGCSIADGCLIAAGSVVTKSITTPNVVVGGNPAKVICGTDKFMSKHNENFYSLHGLTKMQRKEVILKNSERLIKR